MKIHILASFLSILLVAGCGGSGLPGEQKAVADNNLPSSEGMETATFAAGRFWYLDAAFEELDGLKYVISGYAGGDAGSAGKTVPVEAVQINYDPAVISYPELLDYYWKQFDPTDAGGSFKERGPEYRSYIFYHNDEQKALAEGSKARLNKSGLFKKAITTIVTKFTAFTPAGAAEQHFYKKDPALYASWRKTSGRDEFIMKVWGNLSLSKYRRPPLEELKKTLTKLQFSVTQKNDTEHPFTNEYSKNHKEGIYVDIVSGEPLFSSTEKFESGTGWPSFTKPIDARFITRKIDNTLFTARVEIRSKAGDSHLGHVFNDGPVPTHLRYCMNSAALKFIPKESMRKEGYGSYMWIFK